MSMKQSAPRALDYANLIPRSRRAGASRPLVEALEQRLLLAATLPVVSLAASDARAAETMPLDKADGGMFTITRSGRATADTPALTVNLSIGGTAQGGVNYQAIGTTVVIPQGKAKVTVPVSVLYNPLASSTTTVTLSLQPSGSYSVSPYPTKQTAAVSILDNAPVLSIKAKPKAAETVPGAAAKGGSFTITRAGRITPQSPAVTVALSVSGTASAGGDYTSIPASVVIPQGQAKVTVPVNVLDDLNGEPAETVIVSLAAAVSYHLDAKASKTTATVTIADNEPLMKVSGASGVAGSLLTVSGKLDPLAETYVDFIDADGRVWSVVPDSLTSRKLLAAVPPLLNYDTGEMEAGYYAVSIRQQIPAGTMRTLPVQGLAVNDLPDTGLPAGMLTQRFVQEVETVLDRAISQWQRVGAASGGAVDVAPLVDGLTALKDNFAQRESVLADIISGTTPSVQIGTLNGRDILLDSNALALADQMVAGLFLGRSGQGPAVAAASSALRAQSLSSQLLSADSESLSATADPFGLLQDLGDQFSEFLGKTVPNDILEFARKNQTAGGVVCGGLIVGGMLLGSVGVPVAIAGGVLGAMWFTASTFAPAGITMALEGYSGMLVTGRTSPSNLEKTRKFLWDSGVNLVISQTISAAGAMSGAVGEVVAESVNLARDVRDLAASNEPGSLSDQIATNFEQLQAALRPPPSSSTSVFNGSGTTSGTNSIPLTPGWTPNPYIETFSSTSFTAKLVTSRSLLSMGSFTGTLSMGSNTLTTSFPALRFVAPNGDPIDVPARTEVMDGAAGDMGVSGTSDGTHVTMYLDGPLPPDYSYTITGTLAPGIWGSTQLTLNYYSQINSVPGGVLTMTNTLTLLK